MLWENKKGRGDGHDLNLKYPIVTIGMPTILDSIRLSANQPEVRLHIRFYAFATTTICLCYSCFSCLPSS